MSKQIEFDKNGLITKYGTTSLKNLCPEYDEDKFAECVQRLRNAPTIDDIMRNRPPIVNPKPDYANQAVFDKNGIIVKYRSRDITTYFPYYNEKFVECCIQLVRSSLSVDELSSHRGDAEFFRNEEKRVKLIYKVFKILIFLLEAEYDLVNA